MAKKQAAAPIKQKVNVKKKKKVAVSPRVVVKVRATFNNTLVSVTDHSGNVIANASCGALGFKGSKKSTAYASTKAGEQASQKAFDLGAREAEVIITGIGIGRQAAVKGVRAGGLRITSLADHTPVPHGGTKPRKQPKK